MVLSSMLKLLYFPIKILSFCFADKLEALEFPPEGYE